MKLSFPAFSLVLFFVLPQVFTFTACNNSTAESHTTQGSTTSNFQDIDLPTFEQMRAAADANTLILDVRTPEEVAEGFIPDAIKLDYRAADFADQLASLDRDKTYLVYCRSGGRSAKASELMVELQFEKVYNLEGGYLAWSAAQ